MATAPFWDLDDASVYQQVTADPADLSAWDTAYLAGTQLPGLVKVETSVTRKIDVKTAPGVDGATITFHGLDAARIALTITLWTPDHWAAWQALLPTVQPRAGKPPAKPVSFAHPATSSLGITAVYVEEVGAPKPGSVVGTKEIELKLVQWMKRRSVVSTPLDLGDTVATTQGQGGYGYSGGGAATPPSQSPSYTGPGG